MRLSGFTLPQVREACDPGRTSVGKLRYYRLLGEERCSELQHTLGTDNEMVTCVLWTLLSRYSVYEARDISLNSIPRSLHDCYRDMPCAVVPQRSRH